MTGAKYLREFLRRVGEVVQEPQLTFSVGDVHMEARFRGKIPNGRFVHSVAAWHDSEIENIRGPLLEFALDEMEKRIRAYVAEYPEGEAEVTP